MYPTLPELHRRALAWFLVVLLQMLATDTMVAKGEYVKNLTDADTTTSADDTTQGGEVRCSCNMPRCVTQGYMCKSMLGACFTRNTPTPTHAYTHAHKQYRRWAPMHGCVELLPGIRQEECTRKAGVRQLGPLEGVAATPTQPSPQPDPDLTCCNQDMCNYGDFDVYIQVDGGNFHSQTDMKKRRDSEVESLWFRAATIGVPIAGGFILIMLVLLAGRMLAKENKRQRMTQQVLEERYLKAPLYPVVAAVPPPLHHHHHHHPMCYHPHPTKTTAIPYLNPKNGYQDNPSHYRLPEHQDCTPEELKPLNTAATSDERCHQRESDSMLPT